MRIGIDASNIRGGGGVTHLVELLRVASPSDFGIESVVIWAGEATLQKLENRTWLLKRNESLLDRSLLHRIYWQKFILDERLKNESCDLLFVPGGSYAGKFKPYVTMSQNLLPFEPKEIKRYAFSIFGLKLRLLNFTQTKTFKNANGVIFLTRFAKESVLKQIPLNEELTTIVNHGINSKFFGNTRVQKPISDYNIKSPMRLLYVSFIGEYKHQWNVVEAISMLRKKGYPISITFIGSPDEKKAFKKFNHSLNQFDPEGIFCHYLPKVSYEEIDHYYKNSDLFVFASSCETFGQILTEAMAAGLPIACSNLSAMPELLGDGGVYFNPLSPIEIASTLEKLIEHKELREKISRVSFANSKKFRWERASNETFSFLKKMHSNYKNK
ncbi:glycosyltransferase family 1 protein [Leptospira ognonensis]|uniref:Glycosyltransferase family 1 protein n=1 Tax=Leptospira ognonensis TaxID=2484945 RepID=A0A4R9JYD1_9LEPT|nr:glycosyltransferase family 1 protein [Leptospira ognonensis]TGL57205.1 glycosyltransferase family 1 protein [Leptospira ognonensis]